MLTIEAADQYERQVDAFARAVKGDEPLPYGIDDALANMAVLDALFSSEKTGAWASVDYSGVAGGHVS